jgi:hypothetical protein
MPRSIQKLAFAVLIFSEGFDPSHHILTDQFILFKSGRGGVHIRMANAVTVHDDLLKE